MNDDKPKSIWKKSWKGPKWLGAWLILVAASILIVQAVILFVPGGSSNLVGETPVLFFLLAAVLATVLFCAWLFVRWLCRWKNFRRFLFACACLATLIALAYAEEDWRGKHDWDQFKSQWEAKGEKFDYASVVPPSVPDNQNFAMAPIFDAIDKSMSQKWRTQHENPHYGKNGDFRPWDTNIIDRLDMGVTCDDRLPPTNGIGDRQTARMSDLTDWQHYYRTLATKTNWFQQTNLFPVAPQPQTPAQDVLLALSKYDPAIEELREASRRPYSRFPLDYDDENPAAILLPHLAELKRCSQVIQLRAIAELQNGQSDKAFADVKLMLYLANSIRTEPILISQLVRIAIVDIALQPIWEGLAKHQWSDGQLAELDSESARLDFLADCEFALRGERACDLGVVEFLRRSPNKIRAFSDVLGEGDNSHYSFSALVLAFGPSGWFYQNELHIGRFFQNWYLPLVNERERTVSPSAVHATYEALDSELHHRTPENLLEALLLPALGAAVERFTYAQNAVDLVRVAIALERYRLAHGEYPETLDVLVPRFIVKLPHDIINGQPLHYRRTSDGLFVLYSVGWNETDDGGVVGLTKGGSVDINKGDWVWRYPAR